MIEFKLPALGADMDEGTLLEWKVGVGDTVKKGQIVAIVDTTKAAVDVESWQEGTVHQLIAEIGQKMPVGTVMALLLEAGETVPPGVGAGSPATPAPKTAPAVTIAAPAAAPVAAPAAGTRRMISPAARKHAEEKGVDLDAITGTGPRGAVTLEDVEKAAAARPAAAAEQPPGKPSEQQVSRAAEMRKTIAAAMSRSKREIPHYYVAEDIPLAKALAWLQAANAQRSMAERLLPAALLLKGVAMALKRYPEFNGYWRQENGNAGFVPVAAINLGVAISLRQGGLIAPALLQADAKPLTLLMQELTDLVKRTRAGSLRSSEMGEATITVTNLGDQGSRAVFGVITPPQVALVGFGRIAERPWAENGGLRVLPVVTASLSADHRVSDGHRGALFLLELSQLLQHPEELDQ